MMPIIQMLEQIPINTDYSWEAGFVESLKDESDPTCLSIIPCAKLLHSYAQNGYAGTLKQMLCRKSVALKLIQASRQLGSEFCFEIFDAFRTKETQLALFMEFFNRISKADPHLSEREVHEKTRTFVAHPEEKSRFPVPPHNSGGAIDLTLSSCGVQIDMGTDFDDTTILSRTDYFESEYESGVGITKERWELIRRNRRLLFNVMKINGFVNYPEEWWHYDLGDCIWAEAAGESWFYESMEEKITRASTP